MPNTDSWMEEHWVEIKTEVLRRWPDIDAENLADSHGGFEELISLIQQQYGLSADIATRQVVEFIESVRP